MTSSRGWLLGSTGDDRTNLRSLQEGVGERSRSSDPQKRVLFYAFEGGTGLGHLRRLCAIAAHLQGPCACLFVTGHRTAAHWFIPSGCEYVHLPSWDTLFASKATYWGREPFWACSRQEALGLRTEILRGVVRGFRPDALVVDHLPLGAEGELADILDSTPCRKYLVTRGVQNETEDLQRLIFGGGAHASLVKHYDRILAAIDPRVFDFGRRYGLPPEVVGKVLHTGYVTEPIGPDVIVRTRAERGLRPGAVWVVASAGGGQRGEALIKACLALASQHEEIVFDIVMGPRSALPWHRTTENLVDEGAVRLHRETGSMPLFNASADIVISSGGYNTTLEALQGNARILCFPYRTDERDEQVQHAQYLKPFVDLEVSTDLGELPALFSHVLARVRTSVPADDRRLLDLRGAPRIAEIVLEDLASALQPGGVP